MGEHNLRELLQRAADRCSYTREMFEERKIPSDPSLLVVMPFFGDIRSLFVLSSIVLKRYREEMKGSKYFVLCSWPGAHTLFPYVDEYWSFSDESQLRKLYAETDGFRNRSDLYAVNLRNLNEYFRDVADARELEIYYNNGITQAFWDRFKQVKRTLPMVSSAAILGKDFNRDLAGKAGYKLFMLPSFQVKSWRLGKAKSVSVTRDFWVALIKRLLAENYVPVLWKHPLGYDLSTEFSSECIHIADKDLTKILSAMRATGCVLDVFNGLSRLAIAARTPYLCCDERSRYMATREYEIDDLCGPQVPRQYIFSFSTIIEGGNPQVWDDSLLDNIATRLGEYLPSLNRDSWPSTGESTELVSYDTVRKRKTKSIGTKLLKIPKE